MSWIIIIDGYNVLQSWPPFSNLLDSTFPTQPKDPKFAQARDRLVRLIAEYAQYRGLRAVVVFDAHQRKTHHPTRNIQEGLEVIYTKWQQTADDYIIDWVHKYDGDLEIEVITSDQELSQKVREFGATARSTFEFSDTYSRARPTRQGRFQDAIPDSDPLLADRVDSKTRRQLEMLKRQLKNQ